MIPPKRGLVNLSERETTPLVGVGYVSVVILQQSTSAFWSEVRNTHVKVVKGSIASACLLRHCYPLSKLFKLDEAWKDRWVVK